MNWKQREAWDKMLDLLKEAQQMPPNSVHKTNKLLEAIVYGTGISLCREDKNGNVQRKAGSSTKKFKS